MFTYVRNTPREYFNFACGLSLGLCTVATFLAIQFQRMENELGLGGLPLPNSFTQQLSISTYVWRA